MARGLVLGATLISVFTLILTLVYTVIPLWLVLRIESDQQFCWHGEGIFHSRVYYGSYLEKVFMQCEDPLGLGPLTTSEAYCSDHPVPRLNDEDPEDYSERMCTATNRAKATSATSCATAAVTVMIGIALHFTKLRRKYEYVLVLLAFGLSLLTIGLAVATGAIMLTSPLFSMAHNRAMSKEHKDGIPFNGYACSLTTPLRSPFTALLSSSLHCLFPGPSTLAIVLLVIGQSMASGFFFMLARQIRNVRRRARTVSSAREPLLSPSPMVAQYYHEDDEHHYHMEQGGLAADNQVLSELRNVRIYSLYGAMARRTSSWPRFRQWLVITFFPFVLFLMHALWWTGFILLGVQIIGGFKLKVALPPYYDGPILSASDNNTKVTFVESLDALPSGLVAAVRTALELKKDEIRTWSLTQQVVLGGHRKELILFEDIVNVFNFSPELSISYFYNNGAAFIAVLTFLAMFVLPIGKSLFWVWYWFAPDDEWCRGWVLTIVDFSGKWMLAYIFVMAVMGAAMALDLTIVLPWYLFPGILPKQSQVLMNLGIGLTWNGLGSWLLLLACVSSLLLGQIILYVHQVAVEWEERRREMRDLTQLSPLVSNSATANATPSTVSTAPTPTITAESPSILGADTPAMLSRALPSQMNAHAQSRVAVLMDPHSHQRTQGGSRSVIQAIQSFSNLQDLANPHPQATETGPRPITAAMDHDSERMKLDALEARKPILTAIARYGSRTLLQEEADEDEAAIGDDTGPLLSGVHLSTASVAGAPSSQVGGGLNKKNNHSSSALRQLAGPVNPRIKLSRAIHPEVEAMCDRVHQPMQGVRLRWTPRGKALIWFFFFLLSAMFIMSQMLNIFQIEQTGVEMIFKGRRQELSVLSTAQAVLEGRWGGREPYQAAALLFITLSIMPLIRLLLVAYLWVLPLTVSQQKTMFSFLEFSEAWSSLEVFLVTLVGTKVEMPQIMSGLTGAMTPKITELILFIFPFFDGMASAKMRVLPGFWFVLSAVLLEKIVSRLIMQQAATAIAERQAERILRNLARGAHATVGNLERIDENLSWDGVHSTRRDITGMIGDATEGLLETNAAFFFSPAGRYTIAPRTFYAGLPRHLWTGLFVRYGLMGDAEVVRAFGSPSSFSPTATTPGQHEMVNDGFLLETGDHQHNLLHYQPSSMRAPSTGGGNGGMGTGGSGGALLGDEEEEDERQSHQLHVQPSSGNSPPMF